MNGMIQGKGNLAVIKKAVWLSHKNEKILRHRENAFMYNLK